MKNVAEQCLEITSLFEAEILVQLMLERWGHPFANDRDYAKGLIENAASALRNAKQGEQLLEGVPAKSLNFIAAVWYAENCAVHSGDGPVESIEERNGWLLAVQRALPSCFCDPSDLYPDE